MSNNQKGKLFVFDTETIVDVEAAKNILHIEDASRQDILEKFAAYNKNGFHKHLFHQVIVISYLEIDIQNDKGFETYQIKRLGSANKGKNNELELIKAFFGYLGGANARLVSFNGRSFDMPMLKYRAMLHEIQAPWLYKNGDKWNNYNHRYSTDWHCDMSEVLTDFRAATTISLNEACAVLGLPGKIGIDGAEVTNLYHQGKIAEIRDYCEQDVLNTYLLYLRYALHTGLLAKDGYTSATKGLLDYIEANKERKHLVQFKDTWAARARPATLEAL